MNIFKEKFLSGDIVPKAVSDIVVRVIMLIIGLIIGYYLKIWLF